MAANDVESASSRWSAHSLARAVRKVERDAISVLMDVPGEITDATERMFCFIELEVKYGLKRVLTQA